MKETDRIILEKNCCPVSRYMSQVLSSELSFESSYHEVQEKYKNYPSELICSLNAANFFFDVLNKKIEIWIRQKWCRWKAHEDQEWESRMGGSRMGIKNRRIKNGNQEQEDQESNYLPESNYSRYMCLFFRAVMGKGAKNWLEESIRHYLYSYKWKGNMYGRVTDSAKRKSVYNITYIYKYEYNIS